jgi:dihydrolipoamide dehydrogenase
VAVGRKPVTEGWGLENMGLDMDGPFVKIDHQCRTAMRGVYAIGDLVGEPLLAHKATKQGELVAEIIAGHKRAYDPVSIAAVCFTEPELVGVGLTPDEAKAKGESVITGKFPLAASGRALTMEGGADGGFVRVTARESDHVIWAFMRWASTSPNCRASSPWRWRWARRWRTWPGRSTCTRP